MLLLLLFSSVLGFPLYKDTDSGRAATHQVYSFTTEVWYAPMMWSAWNPLSHRWSFAGGPFSPQIKQGEGTHIYKICTLFLFNHVICFATNIFNLAPFQWGKNTKHNKKTGLCKATFFLSHRNNSYYSVVWPCSHTSSSLLQSLSGSSAPKLLKKSGSQEMK